MNHRGTETQRMGSQPTIQEVEAAVRAVVLGRNGRPGTAPRGADVFPGRLLSLRLAEAIGAGTREVRVAPGTVITPLARDFLKRQGIAVTWASRPEASGDLGEWGFAIADNSGTASALRRVLLDDPREWIELGREVEPASWVGEAAGRGALFLTDEASVAVWRACQVPGVRAASAGDLDAVARAVRKLGVNLLVVEPSGKSIATLKQIGSEFRRGGAPTLPEGLEGMR
jgi:hypothetical protein